jgi:hypothetical protein
MLLAAAAAIEATPLLAWCCAASLDSVLLGA